jgi:hypothetical protein
MIIFHIADGFITPITIKPSVLDIEQTEGLCGYISKTKNMSDDFMLFVLPSIRFNPSPVSALKMKSIITE